MKQVLFLGVGLARVARVAAASAVVLGVAAACTTSSETPPPSGPAPCDPALCATKNECIADVNGETKCRLPCAVHTDCPFNYSCPTSGAERNFCVKSTSEIAQKPTGQWGTSCLPTGGQDGNPACDAETGFACYGTGPTDATSYCTRYDCTTDLDCAGGFYCGTVNVAPNVKTEKRSLGKSRTVCLKHSYCSPCTGDQDCPVIDGQQSRCTDDDSGGKFCSTPCVTGANCRLDASCTRVLEDGTRLCRPRAGGCKGDGTVCSPCRSDADCPDGYCVKSSYSPEMFCTVKSKSECPYPGPGKGTIVKGDCPGFTGLAGTQIGCQSSPDDENIPKDQCVGLIEFGDTGDIACYTKH